MSPNRLRWRKRFFPNCVLFNHPQPQPLSCLGKTQGPRSPRYDSFLYRTSRLFTKHFHMQGTVLTLKGWYYWNSHLTLRKLSFPEAEKLAWGQQGVKIGFWASVSHSGKHKAVFTCTAGRTYQSSSNSGDSCFLAEVNKGGSPHLSSARILWTEPAQWSTWRPLRRLTVHLQSDNNNPSCVNA